MTAWKSGDRVPGWDDRDEVYIGRSTGPRRTQDDAIGHDCHNCGNPFPYEPIRLDSERRLRFCTLACRDAWLRRSDTAVRR